MRYEFVFALPIIVLLAAFVIKGMNLYQRSQTQAFQLPDRQWVGVIDYNNNGKTSVEEIKQGQDILLTSTQATQPTHVTIKHSGHLPKIDENNDEVLTVHDQQYNRLRAYFIPSDNPEEARLVPLHEIGIYGIRLDKHTHHRYHGAILGNSETRRILKVPSTIIQGD